MSPFKALQWPLTAPMFWSARKMGTTRSTASGAHTVSLSAKAMIEPWARRRPAHNASFCRDWLEVPGDGTDNA